MPRLLLSSLALALVLIPAQPAVAQPTDSTAITDSLEAALQRFERASPPAAADSARLRRWADSVQAVGSSTRRTEPANARALFRQSLAAYRALSDSASMGHVMDGVGDTFYIQSRHEEALLHYKNALEVLKRVGDPEPIASILGNIGNLHRFEERHDRALTRYREALAAFRRAGHQAGAAGVLDVIGKVHESQGQYGQALTSHREALQIYRNIDDQVGVADALVEIGIVQWHQGRYEEALSRYQDALGTFREVGDQHEVASTLNNIGIVYDQQSRYEEAISRYREALAIYRDIGDRDGVARTLNNIGIAHKNQGRYEDAAARHQQALKMQREMGDERQIAKALYNLGVVSEAQGRYNKALARYQEALAISREIGDRESTANTLDNIGNVQQHLGRYEEALPRYREALQIRKKIGDRLGTARSLHNMGRLLIEQGQYEEALARSRASLEIARQVGSRKGVAVTLGSLGLVYQKQNRHEEALAQYREALRINKEIGNQRGMAETLEAIGKLNSRQGRLQAATDTLRRAVAVSEGLRQNATSPEARRSLLATQIGAYQTLTAAHVRLGRPDSALRAVEQARARLLADRLAGTATADTSFALPSVPELRRTLGREEAALLYANARSEWPLSAIVVTRDRVIARELPDSTVRAAVERDHPIQLNRLRRERGTLSAALGEGSSPTAAGPPSLAEIIRLYRTQLTSPDADAEDRAGLAARLHDLLLDPVERATASTEELIVIPTGSLGYLPFETLRDSTGQYLVQKKKVRYAQSLTVLRQLRKRDYAKRERSLLALGGAAYEPDPKAGGNSVVAEARGGSTRVATRGHATTLLQNAERRMEQGKSPRPTYQQLGYARWPDLPGTQSEVKRLGKIAGGGATVISGAGASEDSVRTLNEEGRLRSYRRVHFATHGVVVPETPQLSALVLSQEGASDSLAARDGYLTMREIAGMGLQADVAVLSACQTGLGKVVAGEGVVSLSHAFLRAGANATLVSQWKVLDKSTRQFMTAVYERAKADGTSFAEAVTAAKRAFIEGEHGKKNKDPLRWAPFVYYGRE